MCISSSSSHDFRWNHLACSSASKTTQKVNQTNHKWACKQKYGDGLRSATGEWFIKHNQGRWAPEADQEGESESISKSSFRRYNFTTKRINSNRLLPGTYFDQNHLDCRAKICEEPCHVHVEVVYIFSSCSLKLASSQHLVQAATAKGKHSGVADDDPSWLNLLDSLEISLLSEEAASFADRIESTQATSAFCSERHSFWQAVGSVSLPLATSPDSPENGKTGEVSWSWTSWCWDSSTSLPEEGGLLRGHNITAVVQTRTKTFYDGFNRFTTFISVILVLQNTWRRYGRQRCGLVIIVKTSW